MHAPKQVTSFTYGLISFLNIEIFYLFIILLKKTFELQLLLVHLVAIIYI